MTTRVLHVLRAVSTDAGSIGLLLPGLFESLEAIGCRCRALAAEDQSDLGQPESAAAGLPAWPIVRDVEEGVDWADVIHFHGWGYEGVRRVARAARKYGKPFVVSPLGSLSPGPHRAPPWRSVLDRWFGVARVARSGSMFLALHENEAASLWAAVSGERVRVLPYGHRFAPSSEGSGAATSLPPAIAGRCLLVLGPLEPAEGCVTLLKAFAELGPDASGWHVVLAGRDLGQWRTVLEPAIRRKGGADRVQFHPAPGASAQAAWLQRASLVVAPSLVVRPPVSVLQAMAAGVPVIATDRVAPDGVSDSVQVCAADRAGIREALRTLLRMTDAQRQERARAARVRARELWDWSVLAPKYNELYERVARSGRRGVEQDAVAA